MNKLSMLRTWVFLASAAALGCGAKTGLDVPDLEAGIDVPDVADAADVRVPRDVARPMCTAGTFTLAARSSELMLVIDRSGSMQQGLIARGGASKWNLLRAALATTLPRFEAQINVGALFYPEDGAESRTAACALANIPMVDISPSTTNTAPVLSVFDATAPGGGTPTAAALLRAYTWFIRHPNRTRTRFIVLATDGAPNCNGALDPATCICGGPAGGFGGCGGRFSDPSRCLDDVRTVSTIEQLLNNPATSIPTYVIGLAGDDSPAFRATLTAMAAAGGRPRITDTGQRTFYDVQSPADLNRAFASIQNAIARCTFLTPSHPTDPDGLTMQINGVTVPRDTSRINGWDWTDRAGGELTLFGAACPSDATPNSVVTATVVCRAP